MTEVMATQRTLEPSSKKLSIQLAQLQRQLEEAKEKNQRAAFYQQNINDAARDRDPRVKACEFTEAPEQRSAVQNS